MQTIDICRPNTLQISAGWQSRLGELALWQTDIHSGKLL